MTNKILIVLGVLVIVLSGSLIWFLLSSKPEVTPTPPAPEPTATTTPPVGKGVQLKNQDGSTITVEDFRTAPGVVPDPSNVGYFYVSGQLKVGIPYPKYTITFKESNGSFIISLWEEPLKENRILAEEDFLSKVKISRADACRLDYSLLVPQSLDESLSQTNLGFSFCPGAVVLPE